MKTGIALFFALVLLGGCESMGPDSRSGSSSPQASEPATASIESEPQPTAEPAPAAGPRIAVLDWSDYENERAEHRQALLASSRQFLSAEEVGYYMDVQKAQLREILHDTDIGLRHESGLIVLSVAGGDGFASNSSRFSPAIEAQLSLIAPILKEFDKTHITVHGHTDDAGEATYNQELSVRRAMSVARFFADAGIAFERIAVVGYGESSPTSSNKTPAGRAKNRRIEIHIQAVVG
ncbi:MAG: OmpA family protein [Gammaproteobacteria bacterium]|nr:OmpA family protein [Gammaproteobacteria bacterium]